MEAFLVSIADIVQTFFLVCSAAFLFELFTDQLDLPFSFVVAVICGFLTYRWGRWPFRRQRL